jgi:hypothetical protein
MRASCRDGKEFAGESVPPCAGGVCAGGVSLDAPAVQAI